MKTCCDYSLEVPQWGVPQWGTSNEYSHMFLWTNKKNISILWLKKCVLFTALIISVVLKQSTWIVLQQSTWIILQQSTWIILQQSTWIVLQQSTWIVLQQSICFPLQQNTSLSYWKSNSWNHTVESRWQRNTIEHMYLINLQYSDTFFLLYIRVATHSGKRGKWWEKNPCREKSGNLEFCWKSGKNQGISKNHLYMVKIFKLYSCHIFYQFWFLSTMKVN